MIKQHTFEFYTICARFSNRTLSHIVGGAGEVDAQLYVITNTQPRDM